MDQAISKLLFIAAAIAVAAGVTGVAWRTLSSNSPADEPKFDYKNITTETLCNAVGGKWTMPASGSTTPPCAAPSN